MLSKNELHVAFAEGLDIEVLVPPLCEVRPDLKDFTFSEGGPKAWLVVVQRSE